MDDELLKRIKRFRTDYFPKYEGQFKELVAQGQHPTILFVGCSDSRLVPYMLTGAGPGELFIVRNVGALVPPYNGSGGGLHGTAAAIELLPALAPGQWRWLTADEVADLNHKV